MNYNYDATTGELKIDFQTAIGKTTGTIPLENCSNLKSSVVKVEDFSSTKAENISPLKNLTSTFETDLTKSSKEFYKAISQPLVILSDTIKDYQILCPDKVVRIDFADNTSEKMVLKDPDVFDIRRCLFIAIAKHLYKDTLTPKGIEYKATLLSYEKKYVKNVNDAIKDHEKKEKEKLLKLQREKEEKERIKRKRAKNLKRREQLRKKRIEEQIEIQKEAIIRANSRSDEDVKNG